MAFGGNRMFIRQSRLAALVLTLAGMTVLPLPIAAQTWPARPITIVVPFGVGSALDLMARIIGPQLTEILGQAVVIENVSGGGGMTGAARVAKAPADGYQMLIGGVDAMAMNQTLYKKPLYNTNTDFAPVGLVGDQAMVLIARNDLPASGMKEFIDYAKANHAKMQFASGGVGSGAHLNCARVNAAIGVEITHIPYRGSAQALQDLFAGRIDYYCALAAAAMGPI
jgi:tripartite-type tricarboxylate transporter receptor subunit TctC